MFNVHVVSFFQNILSAIILGTCSILMHWKSYTQSLFLIAFAFWVDEESFVPLLVSILLEIEPFLDEDATTPSLNCWNIWVDLFLSVSSKTTTTGEMMAPFPILLSYWTRNKIFLYSMLHCNMWRILLQLCCHFPSLTKGSKTCNIHISLLLFLPLLLTLPSQHMQLASYAIEC